MTLPPFPAYLTEHPSESDMGVCEACHEEGPEVALEYPEGSDLLVCPPCLSTYTEGARP